MRVNKKVIILFLSLILLVSCSKSDDKNDRSNSSNEKTLNKRIKKEITSNDNINGLVIKSMNLDDVFKISILKAKKVSKDQLTKNELLDKDKIKDNKTYLLMEYRIDDLREDRDFSKGIDFLNLIDLKVLGKNKKEEKIIKREYKNKEDKSTIQNIVEIDDQDIEKIDLKFHLNDNKNKTYNMTVIL